MSMLVAQTYEEPVKPTIQRDWTNSTGEGLTLEGYAQVFNEDNVKLNKKMNIDIDRAWEGIQSVLKEKKRTINEWIPQKKKTAKAEQWAERTYQDTVKYFQEKYQSKLDLNYQWVIAWTDYVKEKKLYDDYENRVRVQIIEKKEEERVEKRRLQEIENAKAQKEKKARYAHRIKTEYPAWKKKYDAALAEGKRFENRMRSLIKKYTYVTAFGSKRYDLTDFSTTDKSKWNQSRETLRTMINKVSALAEAERKFESYWNDTATMQKSTQLYRMDQFYWDTSDAW